MRQYLVAGAILIVMMAFQNCGRAVDSNALNSTSDASSTAPVTKVSANEFSSLVLTDAEKAQFFEVDLSSGQIHGFDDRGLATGEHYCLGEKDQLQLKEVLENAEVCKPTVSAKAEQCLMVYQYPYASLKSSSLEVALGEKHDGCEIPVDLCGERASQLKALVSSLVSRVQGMSCN